MKMGRKAFLGAAVCIFLFTFQSAFLMLTHSAGSDEEMYLLAAYRYVKHGVIDIAIDHPPFVKHLAGLPFLFMDLNFPREEVEAVLARSEPFNQWMYGARFLYSMGNPAEEIVIRSRLMLLPFGILLGLFLFDWTNKVSGPVAALYSLVLFSLTPLLIACSSVVMMDFLATTFSFGAFYFLFLYFRSLKFKDLIFSGISTG